MRQHLATVLFLLQFFGFIMKRFLRSISLSAATAALFLMTGVAQAQTFEKGQAYLEVPRPQPTGGDAGKVQVTEFFWYGCPHCNDFEPTLERWAAKQPSYVQLVRVPVAFRSTFEPHSRLYYTLETMGLIDKLHLKAFQEIHQKNNPLDSEKSIMSFLGANGVDVKQAGAVYNSFGVSTKVNSAREMAEAYGLTGVPSMAVAGKYLISSELPQVKSQEGMLKVVDFLVERNKPAAAAAIAAPTPAPAVAPVKKPAETKKKKSQPAE